MCAVVVGAWALYEAASGWYDVYQAGKTVIDPNASIGKKFTMVGLAALSLGGPGGGWTTLGDNVQNVRKITSGRLRGFSRGDTDLEGGLDAAKDLFNQLAGRNPSGRFDRVVLEDGREVVFRAGSKTGTPKLEIIDHDQKFLEKITFRNQE